MKTKVWRFALSAAVTAGAVATSPLASAQSTVTLYGAVDGSLLYVSRTLNPKTGPGGHLFAFGDSGDTPSRFGLRGTEDLGGGMQGMFSLESGINLGTGALGNSNGNFFGRQANIGVRGAFGMLRAGLQYSPFFLAASSMDARGFSDFASGLTVYAHNVAVTGLFNSNSISYSSPEIAGFQGSALLALGGTPGDFQAGRQYSASLRYHIGGFAIVGAVYDGNAGGSAASIPAPSTIPYEGRLVGASYQFNKIDVKASYTKYKVAGGTNNNVFSAGLGAQLSPDVFVDTSVTYSYDSNNSNSHALMGAMGLHYFLSKTTGLYGQVAAVNNHGASDFGLTLGTPFAPTGTTFAATLGLRKSF